MCQQENEGCASRTCAMCGVRNTEELGDGNTECLNCGFIFSPENSGITRADLVVVCEVDWFFDLSPEVQSDWLDVERTLQRKMAVVPA